VSPEGWQKIDALRHPSLECELEHAKLSRLNFPTIRKYDLLRSEQCRWMTVYSEVISVRSACKVGFSVNSPSREGVNLLKIAYCGNSDNATQQRARITSG
jgi:hypothetical protein